ncbi:MAG: radical SAM protein [Dehalococcoidia bacterium]
MERLEGGSPAHFDEKPFIVFWEVTRACTLACLHCRAEAQLQRHPQELTASEGFNLMDQIAALGSPLFIITGGDPLMRPGLLEFVEYATGKGLRVGLALSATGLVTPKVLGRLKETGLARLSFSLDGPTAEIHDLFRRTKGSFERSVRCLTYAREVGLPLQISSTVSRYNAQDLEGIALKVAEFGATVWDVFFLVPTGRGRREDVLSPEEHEQVFEQLYALSKSMPFAIKATAAPHYRRFVLQREGTGALHIRDVNDGRGCCFISHIGEVYPSGFLPLRAGNVREKPLEEIYRRSRLFQELRDVGKLKGKCGRCEYRRTCGGSRARAYALTGDHLAAEPCCVYQPGKDGYETGSC